MSFAQEGSPTDVLKLNVGGTLLQVFRRTLTVMEGSKLASKFSGRWDHSLERDADGNIFIDQDIGIFLPLINFLRAKINEASSLRLAKPPLSVHDFGEDPTLYRDYLRMLDSFGLYDLLYPIQIRNVSRVQGGGPDEVAYDPSGVDMGPIETPQYYFLEMTQNEGTTITSFELRGVAKSSIRPSRCQILVGWIQDDDNPPMPRFPVEEWWPGSLKMMKGSRIKPFGVFYTVDEFTSEWMVRCSWDGSKVRVQGSYGTQSWMDFSVAKGKLGKPIFGGIGRWRLSAVNTSTTTNSDAAHA